VRAEFDALRTGETGTAKEIARVHAECGYLIDPHTAVGVHAARKALARAGLTLGDMDVIEINEAFATQVLGCLRQLGIDFADPRVNPNGGAIAVGHPLGASGARLVLTALRQLERTGGNFALVSLCIGIGQGVAVIIERL
jgi:acetyl-CoA C-acetyltransferase